LRFKGAANIVINLQLIYPNNQEPSMYYTKFIAIAGAALLGLSQIPAPLLAAETYTLDKAHT